MATITLLCNERDEPDIRDSVKDAQTGTSYNWTWSCGRVKKIQVGDRIFIQRTGAGPRGYFASGHTVEAPREERLCLLDIAYKKLSAAYCDTRYNQSLMVHIRIDNVTEFDTPLEIEHLKKLPQFGGCNFHRQGGGTAFDETFAPFLEDAWAKHLGDSSNLVAIENSYHNQNLDTDLQHLPEKTRSQIIQARIGQAQFRQDLINYWKTCTVSEFTTLPLLKASHIKPWAKCDSPKERLDHFNGFLLQPSLDAAFDAGYISFDLDGRIMISRELSEADAKTLGLDASLHLRKFEAKHQHYLDYHRKHVFKN
jgi:HNH endonuclease